MVRRHYNKHKAGPTPLLILLLVLIGVGLLCVFLWNQYVLRQEALRYEGEALYRPEEYSLTVDGTTYRLRKGLESYLLIGLDKYSIDAPDPDAHRNTQQADFLILMLVDHENKSYTALHINRDTMTEIQRYGLAGMKLKSFIGQITLSHTYGGGGTDSCRYTCDAVSKLLLGVPVTHYLSLTMDAIPALNDLVGGVTVLINDDFSNVDPDLVQGTRQRLVGQQALTFVRARAGMKDASNLNRMERQREYMSGLYDAMHKKLSEDGSFSLELADTLTPYMVSDLSAEGLANLAASLNDYSNNGVESISGNAVVGEKFMEYYVDEDALRDQVIRLFLTR